GKPVPPRPTDERLGRAQDAYRQNVGRDWREGLPREWGSMEEGWTRVLETQARGREVGAVWEERVNAALQARQAQLDAEAAGRSYLRPPTISGAEKGAIRRKVLTDVLAEVRQLGGDLDFKGLAHLADGARA